MSEKENETVEVNAQEQESKKEAEVKAGEEEFIEIEAEAGSNGINISEEVVATIASIAASEGNGVASMNGGFVGG